MVSVSKELAETLSIEHGKTLADAPGDVQMSLIHISEPTRPYSISYAAFCLKKKIPATPYVYHGTA